jgi:hypothetical protein
MKANRSRGLRACLLCSAFALLLAPGVVWAEVSVATQSAGAQPGTLYVLDAIEDGPSPISTVWRKFGGNDLARVPLNITGETNGDGGPSIVSDSASGLIAAAWARHSTSGFDVVVSRFVNDAWTTPQVVVDLADDVLDPQLVSDPDGSLHMFYWVDGAVPQVFHVTAPSDLSSWSAPVRVSDAGEPSCRPAGGFYNGVLRVAFEVHNFGVGHAPREVVLSRFENGAFIPEVVAVTNNLGSVQPQIHSHAGKFWVDWVDSEDGTGGGELAWLRLNAQGQWETVRYEPFANDEQREFLVRGGARMHAITIP